MKRMLFGAILFLTGFIGLLVLIVLSVEHPWDYNGITGFHGFLLGTETLWAFLLFCILSIIGIGICVYEVYIAKGE